ncbi:AI-2E family transporter [uncultured Faecalicoccus sp.]|uniref:AI-2E family transporter n=1 Tax=uncultured Faecalicoccus sp. TaxID=1971760 RepID=UPI0025FE7A0E|nr:AI-2E family transporter [uncultured Faecalicoccus sp.]
MHFEITEEMKKKIFVYAGSLSIAVAIAAFFFYFDRVIDILQFLLSIGFPFFLGIFLAFLLHKPSRWFEKKLFGSFKFSSKKKRLLSIIISFILFLCLIALFFGTIIPSLIDSAMQFSDNFTAYWDRLVTYVISLGSSWNVSVSSIEKALNETDVLNTITTTLTKYLPEIANYSYNLIRLVINLILAFVSAFYILLDKESLTMGLKELNYALFDKTTANFITAWTEDAKLVFEKYIVGSIIDSSIIGVSCYIGVSLLQIPYAPMIGFVVGITNVIPVFGPFIGAIPVIVLLLLIDPFYALVFAIFILVLQQIDGNVLKPIVLGDQLGISGFWILFSVTIGGGLAGVVGMFLGVPVFALIYAGVRDFSKARLEKKKIKVTEKKGTIS